MKRMIKPRVRMILGLLCLTLSCAEEGKKLGEPCLAHEECVSRLCTIPQDGGWRPPIEGGVVNKVCAEPGISR